MTDHDSAAALLEDLLEDVDDSALERVRRDTVGDPCHPRPLDFVSAIGATNGALALDVDLPDTDQAAIRQNRIAGDDHRFEIALDLGGQVLRAGLSYPSARKTVQAWGAHAVLASRRSELFETAELVDPDDHADQGDTWSHLDTEPNDRRD